MLGTELLRAHIKCSQELFEEHIKWSEQLFEEHIKWVQGLATNAAPDKGEQSGTEENPDEASADEHIRQSKNWIENHIRNSGERLENHIKRSRERFEGIDKKDGSKTVTLKLKRDRRIENKNELDKLEKKCVEALSAVNKIERKNNALAMGVSLGTGIIGTAFIGLAVYNFVFSHIVLGVLFAAVGTVGWTIGFFSNRKIAKNKSVQTEPHIQEQLDIANYACEQAHALLA